MGEEMETKFMCCDKRTRKIYQPEELCRLHFDKGTPYAFYTWDDGIVLHENLALMQYTNLKDKNKKEIYADFIIRDKDGDKRIVKDYKGAYWAERITPNHDDSDLILLSSCSALSEIIGNKWANPELMEGKE